MAAMLRYKVLETHNTTKEDIFRTLDEAYKSELAGKSKEYFQMILCAATAHNHTELIDLMLDNTRCDLDSMMSLPLPKPVYEQMWSTKCHLNDLKLFEQLHRKGEALERTPRWSCLLKMVRSRQNAYNIMVKFRETYCFSSAEEYSFYCRQLLCAAKKYHFQLLRHMHRCEKYMGSFFEHIVFAIIPSPVFVAIDNGNITLVDLLLRSGSSLTLTLTCSYRTQNLRPSIIYVTSAIEHACALDHAEMLEVLVAYDSVDNSERGMALHFACQYAAINCIRRLLHTDAGRASVNEYDDILHRFERKHQQNGTKISRIVETASKVQFEMGSVRRTALHTVMFFARHNAEITRHLPSVVQQLIGAGAFVNSKDSQHLTPLNYLINETRYMESSWIGITADERHAIVDSARLLLEAGSAPNGPGDKSSLDDILLDRHYWRDARHFSKYLRYIFSKNETLSLKSDLLMLLLEHGAEPLSTNGAPPYHLQVLTIARGLVNVMTDSDLLKDCHLTVDRCTEMMGMLCGMLRCLLLAGNRSVDETTSSSNPFLARNVINGISFPANKFNNLFVDLLFQSTSSASLRKLVGLVISVLNASELKEVTKEMNRRLKLDVDAGSTSDEFLVGARNAIRSISGIEGPGFLQHLARRAAIQAMTRKCLHESTSFEIPRTLNNYVLLKD